LPEKASHGATKAVATGPGGRLYLALIQESAGRMRPRQDCQVVVKKRTRQRILPDSENATVKDHNILKIKTIIDNYRDIFVA
jgi:hypothetical protein